MESILDSVKKLLNIDPSYSYFDTDIIIGINTALSNLVQMGVGDQTGFSIKDSTATWDDFVSDKIIQDQVKTYVYLKTRIIFDPPQNGSLTESINNSIKECEWRIYTHLNY